MDRSVVLRAGAALVAASTFVGANAYVLQHPKNPAAPLQPPTTGEAVLRETLPSATPAPSGSSSPAPSGSSRPAPTASGRQTPRPTERLPQITLQPGVRATALPGISYTHVS